MPARITAHRGPRPIAAAWSEPQAILDANRGRDLQGLPAGTNIPGLGPLSFGSHADIQQAANEYNAERGLGPHPTDYLPINPDRHAVVAKAYDEMVSNPHDPEVQAAYRALKDETRAQYDKALEHGFTFDFHPEDHDPYPNSPREATMDLHTRKHMHNFPTAKGFGNGEEDPDILAAHPMLEQVPDVAWNDKPVSYNDMFRAVHDFYGHGKEGVGFRADGEDNAYRQHSAMYSPQARRALATETRGQNAWVNNGPYGDHNRNARSEDTFYPQQKAGLMPEWSTDPDLHR